MARPLHQIQDDINRVIKEINHAQRNAPGKVPGLWAKKDALIREKKAAAKEQGHA